MHIEYEGRILEINHDEIVAKLEKLNATKKFEHLQRRYVYDFNPVQKSSWIRLRTNGETSTLTIKDIKAKTVEGTNELEIEVDDFDNANLILEKLGYYHRGYQENKRLQYILDGVEIDLDRWPLIPEYLEIEGPDEESVYKTLDKLEIPREKLVTLDVASIYEYYGHGDKVMNDLNFEMEEKEWKILPN